MGGGEGKVSNLTNLVEQERIEEIDDVLNANAAPKHEQL